MRGAEKSREAINVGFEMTGSGDCGKTFEKDLHRPEEPKNQKVIEWRIKQRKRKFGKYLGKKTLGNVCRSGKKGGAVQKVEKNGEEIEWNDDG